MKTSCKNTPSLLLTVVMSTIASIAIAQAPVLDWAHLNNNGTSYSSGSTVGTDTLGNVYFTGNFTGTIDFDPGPGVYNLTSLGTVPSLYIQKLDDGGNFVWAKMIGTVGTSAPLIKKSKVSNNGYITMTGSYQGTIDFDPGAATYNLISGTSFDDTFIWQLDNNGNLNYAKSIGSSSPHSCYPEDITVDNSFNVCITGTFFNTIDFDPSAGVYNLTPPGPGDDSYILKLDMNGDLVWVKNFAPASSADITILSHTIDNLGNIILGGQFHSTVDFDPGVGTFNMSIVNGEGFIMELDALGNFVWAKQYGSLFVQDIEISNLGSIYCGGVYYNTANTDADPGPSIYGLTGGQGGDVYIQKLNPSGGLIWAVSSGGADYSGISGLEIDNNENVIYTGAFTGNSDFDPGAASANFTSVPFNYGNTYITSLNASGQYRYAQTFVGVPGDTYGCASNDLDLDYNHNIYLTGYLSDSVDFNPDLSTSFYLTPATSGNGASYITKLWRCVNSTAIITANGCGQYMSPSGNYTWTTSGTYSDTIPNVTGCDSIITINLTITNIDPSITVSNGVFTSNQSGATYQWGDCNSGLAISGATNQNFMPTLNGSYAVIVTLNGCSDTSVCNTINDVGIESIGSNNISIFPNPTSEILNICTSSKIEIITIMDMNGRTIQNIKNVDNLYLFNINQLPKGCYILSIKTEDSLFTKRVIKN